MSEFQPPVQEASIVSYSEFEGHMRSATLEVRDARGDVFNLSIETNRNYRDRAIEDHALGVESDGDEPVFLVPGEEIDPDTIDEVMNFKPNLLGKFLVKQELPQQD